MACRKLQLQDYFWLIVPESENHVCISYDDIGNLIRQGLDVNANGTLDLASTDRISEQDTIFAQESGDWL